MRSSPVHMFVAACVLAFGVSAVAQEKPQEKPQASGQKEHTMGGCLQKGEVADTYVVINAAEKGPKTIGIVESKANLAPHVGHHIDITGTGVPNKEAETMKSVPKADHYMRVSTLKMVSATCKS
ncbi:MAG TPA: hypothetical protein VMO26_05040 [Vicinamibacterales bacterium]|nr:hypothetical protein [Vicinamibacterales bacterium]